MEDSGPTTHAPVTVPAGWRALAARFTPKSQAHKLATAVGLGVLAVCVQMVVNVPWNRVEPRPGDQGAGDGKKKKKSGAKKPTATAANGASTGGAPGAGVRGSAELARLRAHYSKLPWEAEPVSAPWALTMEQAVRAAADQAFPARARGTHVVAVQCKTVRCALTLARKAVPAPDELAAALRIQKGRDGALLWRDVKTEATPEAIVVTLTPVRDNLAATDIGSPSKPKR